MTKTARVEELLRVMHERGYWTVDEDAAVREILTMGRDPGYIPEGTEDWMQEDGVPRAYDKPRKVPRLDDSGPAVVEHPSTPVYVDDEGHMRVGIRDEQHARDVEAIHLDARLKTIEATLTDIMARLKALEARTLDPSA